MDPFALVDAAMEQMEAAVRVACRWCGFFSKPGSACDVCGSPLPSNAPTVPLEVARAAVFSRAEPISVVDEAPAPEEPPPSTAWERLLGVIGEPDEPAQPRRRVVIDLEEDDQVDEAFADQTLYQDGTADPGADPGVDAFLDELAVGTVLTDLTGQASEESAAAVEPVVRPEFIEFNAADSAGGALFGREWHPRRARPAPAWSGMAPVIRQTSVTIVPIPAWSSPVVPVLVRETVPLVPAWSAEASPRLRMAPRTMPAPAWSHAEAPTVARAAAVFLPAWATVDSPLRRRSVIEPVVPPLPAWGSASIPIRVRPRPVQAAPAWGSASIPIRVRPVVERQLPAWASTHTPVREREAPSVVVPAWSEAAVPGRPPVPHPPSSQPEVPPVALSRVQVGEELAALAIEPDDDEAPAPVRAIARPVGEAAPAGRRLGFLRRGARDTVPTPSVPGPRAAPPRTVDTPAPPQEPVAAAPEHGPPPSATPPASGAEPAAPSADGGKTCSRCGRLSDRALCEACRDALQELHALSLG